MVEAAPLDVLSFVNLPVEHKSAWGPGHFDSRQLAVNGVLLAAHLQSLTRRPVEQSTPIVEGHAGTITPAAYLRALLGGPKDEPMPEGRIALGYCDACLDSSCGVLLAATLSIEGTTVVWSRIGFEQEEIGDAPKLKAFWKKSAPAEPEVVRVPWVTSPFEPEVSLRFDRDQYLETIQSERRRVAASA
jgi:hypothetical protein